MATNVETKTRELCEALLEEIQTGGIRSRIDTFLADAGARGQYEKVMNQGQALQEKQQQGQELSPAEIAAFEGERDALLKNAVAEVLEEHRDLLRDAVRESLEDVALIRAIQAGEKSPLTSRKKIFQQLQRSA